MPPKKRKPVPANRLIAFRMPRDLIDRLSVIATEQGVSRNQIVTALLRYGVERDVRLTPVGKYPDTSLFD